MSQLRVLFATSECAPLVKTGGLADVSAALPAALARAGVDVRVLLPAYPVARAGVPSARPVAEIPGTAEIPGATLLEAVLPSGVPAWLLDAPTLFDRAGGPYQDGRGADWPDNAQRFAALSHAAAVLAAEATPAGWRPDILHCNDWQTGLAPAYVRLRGAPAARTLLTVHNLAFQGIFPPWLLGALGLPTQAFSIDGVEYFGRISFLKAGLFYADALTAVSPTYALEIQREPLGMGLQGLLSTRREALTGILNGIDAELWDPTTDPLIAARYTSRTLHRKARNKRALQERLGLASEAGVPLAAIISRLTHQKGIDLVLEAAEGLVALPLQLAVLGTGEPGFEAALRALAARLPGRVSATVGFDEALAHQLESGADLFLMPSRFEPCGMNQMYSQRYGTPVVAHATGGLVDSVVDWTKESLAAGTATGFLFRESTVPALVEAVARAVSAWSRPRVWRRLQRAGMARDFSWAASAARYLDLYRSLAPDRAP